MSTTYGELIRRVMLNLVDKPHGVSRLLAEAAINDANLLVSLMFKPPLLRTSGTTTIAANQETGDLGTLERYTDILSVETANKKALHFVPFEMFRILIPSNAPALKYFSIRGRTLYVAAAPTSLSSLTVHYDSYAQALTDEADTVAYDEYVPMLVNIATAFAVAALEEGAPKIDVWERVSQRFGIPMTVLQKARTFVSGRPTLLEDVATLSSQLAEGAK